MFFLEKTSVNLIFGWILFDTDMSTRVRTLKFHAPCVRSKMSTILKSPNIKTLRVLIANNFRIQNMDEFGAELRKILQANCISPLPHPSLTDFTHVTCMPNFNWMFTLIPFIFDSIIKSFTWSSMSSSLRRSVKLNFGLIYDSFWNFNFLSNYAILVYEHWTVVPLNFVALDLFMGLNEWMDSRILNADWHTVVVTNRATSFSKS